MKKMKSATNYIVKKSFVSLFLILGLVCSIVGQKSFASKDVVRRYRVEDVPNVQLQNATRYLSAHKSFIAEAHRVAIDSIAAAIRDTLDVEVSLVVLPNFDNSKYSSARDFANQLFNTWGIGNKETNRGLLILLILEEDDREIVFETGYGLEGILTDAICKRIQTQIMLPYLTEAKYGEALEEGLKAVQKLLVDPNNKEVFRNSDEEYLLPVFIFLTLLGVVLITFRHFRRRREVNSGKNAFQRRINYEPFDRDALAAYFSFFHT